MNQEKNGIWTSWNENLTYKYKSLFKITSEKELQEINVNDLDKVSVENSELWHSILNVEENG